MSNKRPHSPPSQANPPPIFFSQPITHLSSSFLGAFSPLLPASTLQSLPQFSTATHKICAWRLPSRQKSLTPHSKTIYETGHDDDGESWAGKRLSNVLHDTQAVGSLVVGRWYGGENIGPVRFTHIEGCAKEAVRKSREASTSTSLSLSSSSGGLDAEASKKRKVDEVAEKKELISALSSRDSNIVALRKLLAEKKARLDDEGEGKQAPPTPLKKQGYEKMSLEALRRVDKARDATVAFILKQIDKVDEELRLVRALEEEEGVEEQGALEEEEDSVQKTKGAGGEDETWKMKKDEETGGKEEQDEEELWKQMDEARQEAEDKKTPTT